MGSSKKNKGNNKAEKKKQRAQKPPPKIFDKETVMKFAWVFGAVVVVFVSMMLKGKTETNSRLEERMRMQLTQSPENRRIIEENLSDEIMKLENQLHMYNKKKNINDSNELLDLFGALGIEYFQVAIARKDPSRRVLLERAAYIFEEGLELATESVAENQFIDLLGQIYSLLKDDCSAADMHKKLLEKQYMSDVDNIDEMYKRLLIVSSIGSCYPEEGIALWDQMILKGHIKAEEAGRCTSCWAFMMRAHWLVGGKEAAQKKFDELGLKNYSPWKHVAQIPSKTFNYALATDESKPWLDPKAYKPCQVLEQNKREIIKEFISYNTSIYDQNTEIMDLSEPHHADSNMAKGGKWAHLYLRRVDEIEGDNGQIGWVESACKMFPKTCEVLQSLPEVDDILAVAADNEAHARHCKNFAPEGDIYCNDDEDQKSFPGSVAFHTLAPGASVKLHAGKTNQRLKCQLVISAPRSDSKDSGGAWTEVGGDRRAEVTGQVHAIDDSYFNEIHNGGDIERVILDVGFWHPDLLDPELADDHRTETIRLDPSFIS